jgi:hypothetical protein
MERLMVLSVIVCFVIGNSYAVPLQAGRQGLA